MASGGWGGELLFVLRSYRGGFSFKQNFAGLEVPVAGRKVEGNVLLTTKIMMHAIKRMHIRSFVRANTQKKCTSKNNTNV